MSSPFVIQSSTNKKGETNSILEDVFKHSPPIKLHLAEHKITPYSEVNEYPSDDEFLTLLNILLRRRNIVLSTPVYFNSMSGVLKNFIDRFYDLKNKPEVLKKLAGSNLFIIAAGDDLKLPNNFEEPFIKLAKFLNMKFGGLLYKSSKMPIDDPYFIEMKEAFLDTFEID